MLNQEQIHKILTEEYGMLYKKAKYDDQHLYFVESKLFGENGLDQLKSERGNFLVYQNRIEDKPFILIFNELAVEIGLYYLDCWGATFDNCEINRAGENWIDVLTESSLRKLAADTIYKVKMEENKKELEKVQDDFK